MANYGGARIFNFLSSLSGVPIDQINFMMCQLVALAFAFVYRKRFSPEKTNFMLRHVIALSVGVSIGIFCFGSQMWHMFAQAGGCYVLMKWAPSYAMHMCVFVFAMLYLSYMHIQRMIYDYGGYTLDVTLPMMMASQKLTSLAFSLHDGLYKKPEALRFDQKHHAVSRMPHPLVFFSYVMNFQGLLVGPLCFFNDYISFVEGKNFPIERPLLLSKEKKGHQKHEEMNPLPAVYRKLTAAFITMIFSLVIAPMWPKIRNVDKDFIAKTPFFARIWFLLISVFFSRCRYYFAWKLAEAVNNASGMGFNGYDAKGNQRWDLLCNVNIRGVEMTTSFKGIVDNWNIQTAIWLKRIVYERAPYSKTILTYMLSAIWHGFYPGYYFSFVSASFVTMAARTVRRNIRPHFQVSLLMRRVYDTITWFSSQVALAYFVIPFTALEMGSTLYFYHYSMYWFLHVGTILALVLMPYKSTKLQSKSTPTADNSISGKMPNNPQPMTTMSTIAATASNLLDVTHSQEIQEIQEQVEEGVKDVLGFGLPPTPVRPSDDDNGQILRNGSADSDASTGNNSDSSSSKSQQQDADPTSSLHHRKPANQLQEQVASGSHGNQKEADQNEAIASNASDISEAITQNQQGVIAGTENEGKKMQ